LKVRRAGRLVSPDISFARRVIALLTANDPAYVHEAAKRGVFAYIVDATPEELQSAIDITLQRFAEYHSLQGAFGRRAAIEQAKGILMARHAIDAERAFEMLRDHSQHSGRKVADIAQAIIDSHLLLLPAPGPTAQPESSA
jgi:AmiR/NasT family two-component response regulator